MSPDDNLIKEAEDYLKKAGGHLKKAKVGLIIAVVGALVALGGWAVKVETRASDAKQATDEFKQAIVSLNKITEAVADEKTTLRNQLVLWGYHKKAVKFWLSNPVGVEPLMVLDSAGGKRFLQGVPYIDRGPLPFYGVRYRLFQTHPDSSVVKIYVDTLWDHPPEVAK